MVIDISNALPFPIYWIQLATKIFRGCDHQIFVSSHYNDINKIIDKFIYTIFYKNQCKILDTLLKTNNKQLNENSNLYFASKESSELLLFFRCSKTSFATPAINQSLFNEQDNLNIYFDNIVKYVPASIYWKDRNHVILFVSQLHAELADYNIRKEIIEKNNYDFVRKDQAKNIIKNDQFFMDINQTAIFQEEAVLRDCISNTFLTSKLPLKGKLGETIGFFRVSILLSFKKLKQLTVSLNNAEISNQAKTEFLENIWHALPTASSESLGYALLVQIHAHNAKRVSKYADDLILSSDALLEALNKILKSIEIARGEILLLKKKFNLYQALVEGIQLNKTQVRIKKLSLKFPYDKAIPNYLISDPARVRRILLKLMTNAFPFAYKGEIKVSARYLKQVIIQLSVSGIGISLDKQREVYRWFKLLIPISQGIYLGIGLALSIVKQFIDDLNDDIHFNRPKQVSTFTNNRSFQESMFVTNENGLNPIQLEESFERSSDAANIASVSQKSPAALVAPSLVLIVEDDIISAKVMQGFMLKLNCQIDIAKDGHSALYFIKNKKYDLILMDYGLPDTNGEEITRQIRLKQSNPISVPIIGLTAHIDEENKLRCIDAGMNAIYIKPLTPEKAAEIVNTYITHHQKILLPSS